MGIRSLNRWQAFGWHFLFSAVLGLAVFLLFRFVWYPGALWTLSGAGKLLLLVVGIDVTLGPLLTLIVFNPKKRSLPFDLATIAVVQLAALSYGVWVMAQSRPVYLVGVVDRIVIVSANELAPEALAEAAAPYRELSWFGPKLIASVSTASGDQRMQETLATIGGGNDIDRMPKYYTTLAAAWPELKARSIPPEKFSAPDRARIDRLLHTRSRSLAEVVALPIQGRTGFGTVLFDQQGILLGSVAVDTLQ